MKYEEHPAAAFQLRSDAELDVGDNGDAATTAPVRLVARTGKPILHSHWGRIVHDLDGMQIPGGRNRIALDYNHNPEQIVGYANHFDTSSGDLVLSGALVPYKDNDTASRIIHLAKNNVPFEASISFADPNTEIEVIGETDKTTVNGFEFTGPGVVVRRWWLRSVAICPSGADRDTNVCLFSSSDQVRVAVLGAEDMENQEVLESPQEEIIDEIKETTEDVEAVEAVEADSDIDSAEAAETAAVEAQEPELAHLTAKSIYEEFGSEGLVLFAQGKSREEIQAGIVSQLRGEIETLRKLLADQNDEPAHFSSPQKDTGRLPLPVRLAK